MNEERFKSPNKIDQESTKVYQSYCSRCGDVGCVLIDGDPGMAPTAYRCDCKKGSWKYSKLKLVDYAPAPIIKPPAIPKILTPRHEHSDRPKLEQEAIDDHVKITQLKTDLKNSVDTSFNFGANAIDPFDDPF